MSKHYNIRSIINGGEIACESSTEFTDSGINISFYDLDSVAQDQLDIKDLMIMHNQKTKVRYQLSHNGTRLPEVPAVISSIKNNEMPGENLWTIHLDIKDK